MLAAVALVAWAPHARSLGFYLDDWVLFGTMLDAGGWWDRVRALAATTYAPRTLSTLVFSTLFSAGRFEPAFYQTLLVVQDWAAALAFFALVRRWTGSERLALTAAALAALYPICPATHHWISNLPQQAALGLTFASLALHFSWLETRRGDRLAGAVALYLASLLLYEAAAFLPAMQAAVWYGRLRVQGLTRGEAARLAGRDVGLVYALPLAAGLLWQHALAPLLTGTPNPKSAQPSLRWALTAYVAALDSLTRECFNLIQNTAPAVRALLGAGLQLLWAAFAAGLGWALSRGSAAGPAWRPAAAAAAAGFAAAYLPFALSGNYEPQVVGIMSRINGSGAFVGGLALACAAEALGRRLRGVLLGALAGAFLWTDWYIARQWVEAWKLEQDIVEKAAAWVNKLPAVQVLALRNAPTQFNGSEVFSEHWGFNAALRIKTGRKDLRGLVVKPTMQSEARGLVDYKTDPPAVTPYDGLFLYDYKADALKRVAPN